MHRLRGISAPWCVVGGWALDLWHGYQTREHEDLEFTILRHDYSAFTQRLSGLRFHTVGGGVVEYLPENDEPPTDIFQIWCEDIEERLWRADMMIEPGTADTWVYKRDTTIFRPRAEMIARTADGIPYLKPAAILLFKAKHQRPKDEVDFDNALEKLAGPDRVWLKACLDAVHPGHGWAKRL
jgi:hypothetical protein